MTATERAALRVTSDLLSASLRIDWLSTAFTLIATGALLLDRRHAIAAVAAAITGVVAKFYAVRIAFDARLFDALASEQLTVDELDRGLAALSLLPEKKMGRECRARCRGAVRLLGVFAALTVAQLGAILVMVAMQWI